MRSHTNGHTHAGVVAPGTLAAEQYQSLRLKLERLQARERSLAREALVEAAGTIAAEQRAEADKVFRQSAEGVHQRRFLETEPKPKSVSRL